MFSKKMTNKSTNACLAQINRLKEKMEKADGCIRDIRKRFGEGMIKNAVLLTGLAVPKSKAVVSLPGNMLNK